jgi:probable F420-dependent oxidoreductase
MQLGVVYPQSEIGHDPVAIRDFAQAAEELGYANLLAFEHVLGVDPSTRPGWSGYYTHRSPFHEPFVLFGYLAGLTQRLAFATNVLVLPQRQTALVAKQAALVDILCDGRLRLGVGVGWNTEEVAGLGADPRTRGARCEEQIDLLRELWTHDVVDFDGRWDHISGMGINPLPVQRPIPIWIGGEADAVLERVGRLADGWFPPMRTPEKLRQDLVRVGAAARAAGRDPSDIGVEARLWPRSPEERTWVAELERWGGEAFTHLSFVTMETGFTTPDAHIDAIRRFMRVADDLGYGEA